MNWFAPVDWQRVFIPDTPLLEIMVRGSVMYFVLFCLFRLVLKRQAGALSLTDLLVVVLIADAAQNAMATDYHSISDGIVLVSTLVFWNYMLEWLGYYFPWLERIIHPPPLPLIRNGRLVRRNMQQELISEEEIMSKLREKGIDAVEKVKEANLEGDGKISIVKNGS